MSFNVARVHACLCGGRPVIRQRSVEVDWSRDVFEWLECNKCGMRSPEKETTYNREDHLAEMAKVWDRIMKSYPPTPTDLEERESE